MGAARAAAPSKGDTVGIWDAISSGEMPSMADVRESGSNAYDSAAGAVSGAGSAIAGGARSVYNAGASAVNTAGEAISDGAGYLADGATSIGQAAYGYGERAVDTVTDLAGAPGRAWDSMWDAHFDRNEHNNAPTNLAGLDRNPEHVGQANEDGWSMMSEGQSIFHQDDSNDTQENKFIHPDGSEYVEYADGSPVTRGDIDGTYNYSAPTDAWSSVKHVALDVVPWLLEGSVRDDHPDNALEGDFWDRSQIRPMANDAYESVSGGLSAAGDAISGGVSAFGQGVSDVAADIAGW